jgi:predicted ATP-grasp superfamily ATP-dependent carboligase
VVIARNRYSAKGDKPQGAVLIAAVSGRALAASARRAGFVPLVADCFGDDDTLALAASHVRLRLDPARGFDPGELLQALERLAAHHAPAGVVCGTGFEDRPELLAEISRRWRLLGNAPRTVARLKDPGCFAALCRDCAIPHPQIVLDRPAAMAGWLAKRAGGAGGTHVKTARPCGGRGTTYYQRRVSGAPVSALVLGDGRAAIVLGLSTQWASPAPGAPFRYGGAVRPATIAPRLAAGLTDAVQRLVPVAPLVGLNSIDFLVEDAAFWLLEVNPRPGATLDIFEPRDASLFALHLAACDGALPGERRELPGAMAAAIVYADRDVESVPMIDWPDWSADRQPAATRVKSGQPLCTVSARASSAAEAKVLAEQRAAAMLATLDARIP